VQMEAALSLIESVRAGGASHHLRTYYFASVQEYYEFYVDLLMRLHREHPSSGYAALALQASERARARSLIALLAEARVDIREGIDPHLLDRERELERQLSAAVAFQRQSLLNRQIASASSTAKQLETLISQLEEFEAEIRSSSPRYAALTQPEPLSAGA